MSNISLSEFVYNNKELRTLAAGLAAQDPGKYDLFDAKSREECLWDVIEGIKLTLSKEEGEKEISGFLIALLSRCQDAVSRKQTPSSKKKAKAGQPKPSAGTADDQAPMDTSDDTVSWADCSPPVARKAKKVSQAKQGTSPAKPKEEKPKPKQKAKPKAQEKEAQPKQPKEKVYFPRTVVPLDMPPVKDAQAVLAHPAFTKNHRGEPILQKETASAEEVLASRQGDWHVQGSCGLCDTMRTRVQYYKSIGDTPLEVKDWLVRPTPYEYRLLILAHAYKISASLSFNQFTKDGRFLNLDQVPCHPTLDDNFIPRADGVAVSVPVRLGTTAKELALKNHRVGLADLKKLHTA